MKICLAIWGLAAALAALGGCERKSADRPDSFDPKLDSLSAAGEGRLDPGLLADQEQIAKGSSKRRGATATDSVAAAKETLTQMGEAMKAQDYDKTLEFLAPQDAAALKPFLMGLKELSKPAEAFRQLVKDRLGIDLPEENGLTSSWTSVCPWSADEAVLEKMTFEQTEGKVTASTAEGGKVTLVEADGAWKVQLGLPPGLPPVLVEMVDVMKVVMSSVEAGINDGTITKDHFEAKTQEISSAKMLPVMAKLMEVMAKIKPAQPPAGGPVAAGSGRQVDISADFPVGQAKPAEQAVVAEVRQFIGDLASAVEGKQFDQIVAMYDGKDGSLVRPAIRGNWTLKKNRDAIAAATRDAQAKGIDLQAAGRAFDAVSSPSLREAVLEPVRQSLELKPFASVECKVEYAGDKVLVSAPGGRLLLVKVGGEWKRRLLTRERKVLTALRGLYGAIDDSWMQLVKAFNAGSITSQADLDAQAAALAGKSILPASMALEMVVGAPGAGTPAAEGAVVPVPSSAAPAAVAGEPNAGGAVAEVRPVDPNASAEPEQQYQQDRGPEKARQLKDRLLKPTKRLTGGGS